MNITKTTLQSEFFHILNNRLIDIHFQPIVSLKEGVVHGYEALSRGPKDSHFYSPYNLFPFAEKEGYLYSLEKIARELAIRQSSSLLNNNEKLFINISAPVIHEPNFTPGHTISLLEDYNLSASDVIFEITERSAITDFCAFKEVLNHYREQGFKIAIDDAGAGYSSLQAISELTPDYIKVDRSLISGINDNKIKVGILEAFVTFAKKMNSKIIAEGVETEKELQKVIDLGIDLAQGYYLGRPAESVKMVSKEAMNTIWKSHDCNHEKRKGKIVIAQEEDEIVIVQNGEVVGRKWVSDIM